MFIYLDDRSRSIIQGITLYLFLEFLESFLPEVTVTIAPDSIRFLQQEYFYFARLRQKYLQRIYPIVVFSFDEPQRAEANTYTVEFLDRKVPKFNGLNGTFNFRFSKDDSGIIEEIFRDLGFAVSLKRSRFFSWIGQFQWVQQLSSRNLIVARIDAQLTPDRLLPLEQFSLGGVDTVRGYQQNQLVADNGLLASLEFRIPLTGDPRILQLTPFVEVSTGWNNRALNPNLQVIAGIGAGLRWQILRGLTLRLDYGFPLVDVGDRGGSLQENGFYFSLRYQPF